MILAHTNFTDLYADVLRCLLHASTPLAKPREMATKEQIGCYLKLLHPDENLLVSPARKFSFPFAVADLSWILCGSNDLALIEPYNKAMAKFSDDGMHLTGAYGPPFTDQLPYIIQKLREDPWSRQAVISLWRPRPMESKDVPCTLDLQFFIRPHEVHGICLDLVVHMRSNDAWLGLPYDLFTFTMLQKYVAGMFHAYPGTYHHFVGSLHLYERDWAQAQRVVEESQDITWRPKTSELGLMPTDYKACYTALTLMARHSETYDEMKSWVSMNEEMAQPWRDFLHVLAFRFHQDIRWLPNPWHELITGRTA